MQDDGTAHSLFANTFDGTDWSTEQMLETSDAEVAPDYRKAPNMIAVSGSYTIGWLQADENDAEIDNAWVYSNLMD